MIMFMYVKSIIVTLLFLIENGVALTQINYLSLFSGTMRINYPLVLSMRT